jgi:citrate lyase subunit beta/citryl-CoA lyase
MLERAGQLAADALILDLEDAVPPEGKERARDRVASWLQAQTRSEAARLVRINPLEAPWGLDDLEMAVTAEADGIVVPKVSRGADLEALGEKLAELEVRLGREPGATGVIAIATETPRAVLHVEEIAEGSRVQGLAWGSEDLSAALGATRTRGEDGRHLPVFEMSRQWVLLAAHAVGVAAIDGVYTDFRDIEGLEAEAAEAAATGFTGKLTIHPGQIEPVNRAFTPSADEVTAARALLAAYEAHRKAGRGAFAHEGEMIDAPHLARAQVLLDRADR